MSSHFLPHCILLRKCLKFKNDWCIIWCLRFQNSWRRMKFLVFSIFGIFCVSAYVPQERNNFRYAFQNYFDDSEYALSPDFYPYLSKSDQFAPISMIYFQFLMAKSVWKYFRKIRRSWNRASETKRRFFGSSDFAFVSKHQGFW